MFAPCGCNSNESIISLALTVPEVVVFGKQFTTESKDSGLAVFLVFLYLSIHEHDGSLTHWVKIRHKLHTNNRTAIVLMGIKNALAGGQRARFHRKYQFNFCGIVEEDWGFNAQRSTCTCMKRHYAVIIKCRAQPFTACEWLGAHSQADDTVI